ncbi:MAG TPA: protein kinase [Kofleriaceae bacterium]|nr:protein kinase [Kofleriaceae bacterium]
MSDAIEEFGPYLVYERLGQGGMATVHRAEKQGVGIRRPIALKRLLPHIAAEPDLVKLFVDEARLASHLHHANVAQTYELGRVGDVFFIAMEYAPGPTLTQIMRQSQRAAGEIPLTVTVNILIQICEALDYAHNLCDETGRPLRIIHRDVSPANIVVTSGGVVKLIDFGIAKTALSSVKTQTGFIKGKFGYIAPEYITGKIDARVDLFAVGVIAHELLAGRRLFEGRDDFETLGNIREMTLAPPSHWNPHVTEDLDDIVMTALERDPDHRWQSAAAMHVALANVARDFGLMVGNPQLAEWVDWAFRQPPRDGRLDTDRDPASSLSIEVGLGRGDTDRPSWQRAQSPSDSDETVPIERVRRAFSNLEVLTPPAMAAAQLTAVEPRPRARREREATVPPPVPPLPARPSRAPVTGSPPHGADLPAPPARATDASMPAVMAQREIEVIVVPPGRMFEMPAQEIDEVAPAARPTRRARSSRPPTESPGGERPAEAIAAATARAAPGAATDPQADEVERPLAPSHAGARATSGIADGPAAAEDAPRKASSIWWLILLMIALGVGAMAAAYFWPGDL